MLTKRKSDLNYGLKLDANILDYYEQGKIILKEFEEVLDRILRNATSDGVKAYTGLRSA